MNPDDLASLARRIREESTAAGALCTCPPDATLDEVLMVGGHWEDCPRRKWVEAKVLPL